ncbi:hypothetical protein BT69DRAFT_1283258 [Atractiella rhizophila]|nr:hypothetical protein BT69DRAFT_1283258 [Atractiella rhizophila]
MSFFAGFRQMGTGRQLAVLGTLGFGAWAIGTMVYDVGRLITIQQNELSKEQHPVPKAPTMKDVFSNEKDGGPR